MSATYIRTEHDQRREQTRRQFLRRAAGLAAVLAGLGTLGEAAGQTRGFSPERLANGGAMSEAALWEGWNSLGALPATGDSADPGLPGARIADWSSLGGGLTSRPAVGRNEDGRLEVFVRGNDNALWQKWQLTSGGWSGWNSLGGIVTSNIAVGNNLDGRLEVFVRGTDNSLFHRWQTTPNGNWSAYSRLDGILTSDPTLTRSWDGRLHVFVRGTDKAIWYRAQVAPNSNWTDWATLGGEVNSNIAAITHNSGGGLNLFWVGPDNRLFWRRQTGANGAWEAIRRLGGPIITDDPVVAEFDGQRSDARLVVFVRGTDQSLWYRYQIFPNSTTWSNWISLGGKWVGKPAVAANWDGRLEIFVRNANGAVYRTWQTQTDSAGSWNGWFSFGGVLTSEPVVGTNRDGRLEIFGVGTDRALWHRWQVTPGGGWS